MKNITYKFLALFMASTLVTACGDKEKDNESNGYSHNEEAKTEIIEEIPDDKVSVYTQGDFTDLFRGPHIPNTSRIRKFKLLSLSGAYLRGN